jgi:hypothetical protein
MQVDGARELRRTLKQAGDDLNDLKDVHAAVGRLVAERAQATAPRRSGKLAASVRANRAASGSAIVAGRASVPYAGPIHWGWRRRRIEPNPWISEAAQATEPQWVAVYTDGVQAVMDNVNGD